MLNVLFAATSCPRSESDWQSIFIRRIADALAARDDLCVRCWAPEGPRDPRITSALTARDARFLRELTDEGGIAHLIRNRRARAVMRGTELLARQHFAYRRERDWADVYHLNWLQCALGHVGVGKGALVTVLGTDMALLRLPGMRSALRVAFRGKPVVLCPNAEWMVPTLTRAFGDCCADIVHIPFGVDDRWFQVKRAVADGPRHWLTVLRVTQPKIGTLFEWTRSLDPREHRFHLFGPLQEPLEIPPWIDYHGPATPDALAREWYPMASGLISLSQHDEGRPQVMLDAMASGLPVIASPIRAHADLIRHGENGLLCATREEFLRALDTLSDNAQATAIAAAALDMIRHTCGTWHDCAARYQSIYSRLGRAPEQ